MSKSNVDITYTGGAPVLIPSDECPDIHLEHGTKTSVPRSVALTVAGRKHFTVHDEAVRDEGIAAQRARLELARAACRAMNTPEQCKVEARKEARRKEQESAAKPKAAEPKATEPKKRNAGKPGNAGAKE